MNDKNVKKIIEDIVRSSIKYISSKITRDQREFEYDRALSDIQSILTNQRNNLLDEMLEECDKTENEAGRLLVMKFKEKI